MLLWPKLAFCLERGVMSQILCYRSNSCCLRTSIIPVDTFFTGSLCNDRNALAVDLRFINFKLFGQSVFLSVTLGSSCLACIYSSQHVWKS